MPRFGLNTFLYASPFTTESVKLFPKLKKWGFETVEIPVEALEHIDPVKVRSGALNAGLKIGSICACMGQAGNYGGNKRKQQTARPDAKGLMAQAPIMASPSVIGPIYSVVGLI